MLRAKYKVEDYMTSTTEANNKYRRKSTEQQHQQNHENNSTSSVQLRKESAPATLNLKTTTTTNGTTKIIDKKSNSSPVRETGLIDEDVNVKERAAIFGGSTTKNNRAKSWTANLITPSNNSKNAMNTNTRPISDTTHVNMSNQSNRKMSPGSPSKIRD